MTWMERNTVSLRQEFVQLAMQEGANVRELCRRFAISPKTGYKWLGRWQASAAPQALQDRSRRPLHSPARSAQSVEQAVVHMRQQHPTWGGRKIARILQDRGLGNVAASTVTHLAQTWSHRSACQPCCPAMAALCARSAQCVVADRLQRALQDAGWHVPCADLDR